MNKKGFSLAEMMVVMLILSIVLAASAPIITKRVANTGGGDLWSPTTNGKDIYYGVDGAHRVSIGTNTIPARDAMLSMESYKKAYQMVFYDNGAYSGAVVSNYAGQVGLGNITLSNSYSTAIGNNASATGTGSVAIGCDSFGNGAATATDNEIRLGTSNHHVNAPGEIQSTSTGIAQFRAVQGNYGAMIRNDGTDTYVLVTNAGDPNGSWSAARPIRINNATGKVYIDGLVPPGTIIWYARSTPPVGYLECNGQSTSGYPDLAAVVGANVPDLRGEFIRGWDHGRNIDISRSLLSIQRPTNIRVLIDNYKGYPVGTYAVGASDIDGMNYWTGGGYSTETFTDGLNATFYENYQAVACAGSGDNESFSVRPTNVSLLPCIKY